MGDQFNTIAGWVLAAGIVALGASIASGMYFDAEAPEKPGYAVADADPGAGGTAGAAALVPIASMMGAADMASGAEVFKKCASCHNIAPGGANGQGPALHGIMGKPLAQVAGFAYSDALKSKGGNWGWEEMNAWLASPRKFAPGTKMTFAGLSDAKDRADILLYMNAQGSNLPIPAAPPPGAEAGNAAAPAEGAANAAAPADGAAGAAAAQGAPANVGNEAAAAAN